MEDFEREREHVNRQQDQIKERKKRVEEEVERYKEKQQEIAARLSQISGMTRDEAKAMLLNTMEEEAKVDFAKQYRRIEEEMKENAEKEAKKVIGTSIQRFAGEYVAEKAITSVELPNDDVKGRLIGREGRNIRAFEQICGVDLIVDDTPEVVVISSFQCRSSRNRSSNTYQTYRRWPYPSRLK